MKTVTLKSKAVLLAFALASTYQAQVHSMLPDITTQNILTLNDGEFFETIVLKVEDDAIKAIIDLVKGFIDKTNKANFSTRIDKCKERSFIIQISILNPLKQRIEIARVQQPGSQFFMVLEKTYKLANEMAYKEMQNLISILENHKNDSKNAKKATILASKLKPFFAKITSVNTLNSLEQKISEIQALLPATSSMRVFQEFDRLKILVQEIKSEIALIQNKVDIELLPVLSDMLALP